MTDLNLRHLVQEVVSSASSVEYADITAEVLNRLDRKDVRAALIQALPAYVRSVVVTSRTMSGERTFTPSAKVEGIRANAATLTEKRLAEIFATSTGNKRFGAFTYDDILFQVAILEQQAAANLGRAVFLRDLAGRMQAEGFKTVSDVPVEALGFALGVAS